MKTTNYHLTIKNNNQDYYFYHDYICAGDILRIDGYRVVIDHIEYDAPYTKLSASLVNEGTTLITDLR